jgi:hypothetical protein
VRGKLKSISHFNEYTNIYQNIYIYLKYKIIFLEISFFGTYIFFGHHERNIPNFHFIFFLSKVLLNKCWYVSLC